jgi:CARDB
VPCKLPDLTAGPQVSVGGHNTTWGAGVTLTDKDSIPHARPFCAFNIAYVLANIGLGNAGPPAVFKDVLRVDGTTVSIQSMLTQAALTHRNILTQAYLPMGVHTLTLDIDDGNAIAETNEGNNHFSLKYQLTGRCRTGNK